MGVPKVVIQDGDELVRVLAELAQEHGPRISIKKFTRLSGIAESQIYKWFDSWGDVREGAGLSRRIKGQAWYSDDDILAEIHRLIQELRRVPTCKEFSMFSNMTVQQIYRRFGSMPAAMRAYRGWVERNLGRPKEPVPVEAKNPQQAAADWQREVRLLRRSWFMLRVGFELVSSDFRGRPADACDLLVVLKHDWPACPVKVLEYGAVAERLVAEEGDGEELRAEGS